MNTRKLVAGFCSGTIWDKSASGGRLLVNKEGNKLVFINYSTVIAVRDVEGTIYLNDDQYSSTTSKHQNRVKDHTPHFRLEIVTEEEIKEIR